ncbi:hypothetical protein GPA27_18820 [Aromatoleum toluolicum]|uniref:Uncharacterized protein n=1 Tax=Aromatoleum toluolicum TaxID=90060 RepID=A0ABX1NJE7_9RHOO|nr:hypothetical protein [Aromatoleum toluolicum]NMF99436.1 hypothetical protein [Aromatoleum toluolicum]
MLKSTLPLIALGFSALCSNAEAQSAPPDCNASSRNMENASRAYGQAIDNFNEENPPDELKPDACVGGVVRWEKTSFKMDIPEFKMGRKSWKMDVPETKMVNQEWWIKEPFIRCENKKTGQYPETFCEDTWIRVGPVKTKGVPKCTVKWSDIITKICWPETRDKRVVVGVPEFKMVTQEMSMDVPEVTMRTRELSLHLPQFSVDSGCIGPDCAELCKRESEDQIEKLESSRTAAIRPAKEQLIVKAADMFQCQGNALEWQKANALGEFDKYITVARMTLDSMTSQGLLEAAAEQKVRLDDMLKQREKIVAELDVALADLKSQERETIGKLAQ